MEAFNFSIPFDRQLKVLWTSPHHVGFLFLAVQSTSTWYWRHMRPREFDAAINKLWEESLTPNSRAELESCAIIQDVKDYCIWLWSNVTEDSPDSRKFRSFAETAQGYLSYMLLRRLCCNFKVFQTCGIVNRKNNNPAWFDQDTVKTVAKYCKGLWLESYNLNLPLRESEEYEDNNQAYHSFLRKRQHDDDE